MSRQQYFLLYDNRSGSTLLSAILNSYSGITVTLESGYVSRIIEYRSSLTKVTELVDYLFDEIQFNELTIKKEILIEKLNLEEKPLSKKQIIEVINNLLVEKEFNSEVLIIKHPPYHYLNEVVTLFPRAKFIHLVRDGRAVFHSKKKSKNLAGYSMESNPIKAALDWKLRLSKVLKLGEKVYPLRYENVIRDKETELSKLFDWMDISQAAKEKISNTASYASRIGVNQRGLHVNVDKDLSEHHIDKWKSHLTKNEIAIYEFLCSKELKSWGYELTSKKNGMIIFLVSYYCIWNGLVRLKNGLQYMLMPSLFLSKLRRNFNLYLKK